MNELNGPMLGRGQALDWARRGVVHIFFIQRNYQLEILSDLKLDTCTALNDVLHLDIVPFAHLDKARLD